MIEKILIQKVNEDTTVYLSGVSIKGKEKNENQDAFTIGISENGKIVFAAVADGLGSCISSAQGAKMAVQIVRDWAMNDLQQYSRLTENVANIFNKRLLERWAKAFAKYKLYDFDTTLHYVISHNGGLLLGGIGDGMMLYSDESDNCRDYVSKNKFFTNVTNSLCTDRAGELFSDSVIEINQKKHVVIVMATDGIAEDVIPEKKCILPEYFYDVIKSKGIDKLQKELIEWLENWQTIGHCDDKTIVTLIIDRE